MTTGPVDVATFQEILERQQGQLLPVLPKRYGITSNVERGSSLASEVRAAMRRIHDGSCGACIDCDSAITPKGLEAVPRALRCFKLQDASDRDGQETADVNELLVNAA